MTFTPPAADPDQPVTLHIHLRSGQSLAWDLPRKLAEHVRDRIREFWHNPAEFDGREVAFGEADQLDTWIRADAVDAVQLYPLEEPPAGGEGTSP